VPILEKPKGKKKESRPKFVGLKKKPLENTVLSSDSLVDIDLKELINKSQEEGGNILPEDLIQQRDSSDNSKVNKENKVMMGNDSFKGTKAELHKRIDDNIKQNQHYLANLGDQQKRDEDEKLSKQSSMSSKSSVYAKIIA